MTGSDDAAKGKAPDRAVNKLTKGAFKILSRKRRRPAYQNPGSHQL